MKKKLFGLIFAVAAVLMIFSVSAFAEEEAEPVAEEEIAAELPEEDMVPEVVPEDDLIPFADDHEVVSIAVTVDEPAPGQTVDSFLSTVSCTLTDADGNTVSDVTVYVTPYQFTEMSFDSAEWVDGDDAMIRGRYYGEDLRFILPEGYTFAEGCTATVNGSTASVVGAYNYYNAGADEWVLVFAMKAGEAIRVTSANVSVSAPVAGQTVGEWLSTVTYTVCDADGNNFYTFEYDITLRPTDYEFTVMSFGSAEWVDSDDVIVAGRYYGQELHLILPEGFVFADGFEFTVNGDSAAQVEGYNYGYADGDEWVFVFALEAEEPAPEENPDDGSDDGETPGTPDEPTTPDEPAAPEDPATPDEPAAPAPGANADGTAQTPAAPANPAAPATGDSTGYLTWMIVFAAGAALAVSSFAIKKRYVED